MQDDKELAQTIAREVAHAGGRVYYVGGYVRDELLGRENKDIDIEVHGIDAEALREVLAKLGRVELVGASFGVFNLHGHTLDIALPCRGHAVDPHLGTYEAARRRDLTMNALYEDVLTGEIIDHFGGQDDLARGVIRHVDAQTFREDPLRVLRVAQFAARFGMRVDGETVGLCADIDVSGLACERVLEELRKALLKASRPSTFFETLRAMDKLMPWFVEAADLVGVPQNPTYHPEGDVWTHTMLVVDEAAKLRGQATEAWPFMLAALCHDYGKASTTQELDGRFVSYGHEEAGVKLARAFLNRLRASNHTKSYVTNMVELHMRPNMLVGAGARQKSFSRLFDRSVCPHDLVLLAMVDDAGRGASDTAEERGGYGAECGAELSERLRAFEELMARPYVQGRDLLEAGIEPGPLMGEVLVHAHKLRLVGMSKDDQLRQCLGLYRRLRRTCGVAS